MEKQIQAALDAARKALEVAHMAHASSDTIQALHNAVNALIDAKIIVEKQT